MSVPLHQDWEETDYRKKGSYRSVPGKRPRCSCCRDDKQAELLEEMRSMLQRQTERLESMFRENQHLRDKVSCLTADISRLYGYLQQAPARRMLSDQIGSVQLQLKFLNSCKNDKYSTRQIEADDGSPLKVAICDQNNNLVTCEPFSSMRVQIVPIHGDFDDDRKGQWTEEYFCSKIVTGRPGKKHLLSGDLYLRLQNGVGYLNSAKFQDNSSFVASKRFKLGVMVADERISERIQEGITESFAVKDVRGFTTKKNVYPSPRDAVYKLRRIATNGDRHKLLEQNGIKTVEDLLCFYRKSPKDLRKMLGKISDQEWDMIIKHAHQCNPGFGIYSSCIQEMNVRHEHEPFSRSNGSCYFQGSCSMQPSPIQQKQHDVHVTHQQQHSSTHRELSSGASLEDVPSRHTVSQSHGFSEEGPLHTALNDIDSYEDYHPLHPSSPSSAIPPTSVDAEPEWTGLEHFAWFPGMMNGSHEGELTLLPHKDDGHGSGHGGSSNGHGDDCGGRKNGCHDNYVVRDNDDGGPDSRGRQDDGSLSSLMAQAPTVEGDTKRWTRDHSASPPLGIWVGMEDPVLSHFDDSGISWSALLDVDPMLLEVDICSSANSMSAGYHSS